MVAEILFDSAIIWWLRIAGGEVKCDACDKKASALFSLEKAAPIAKTTRFARDICQLTGGGVKNLDTHECLGNILSVCAYILNGRGTGGTGNKAERFDTGESGLDGAGDDRIPVFTSAHGDIVTASVFIVIFVAHDMVGDDEAGKAFVAPDDIAAATNDNNRQLSFCGPAPGLAHFPFGSYLCKVGRFSAEAHRRVFGQ